MVERYADVVIFHKQTQSKHGAYTVANKMSKHKTQSKHKHETNTNTANATATNTNTKHSKHTHNNL